MSLPRVMEGVEFRKLDEIRSVTKMILRTFVVKGLEIGDIRGR